MCAIPHSSPGRILNPVTPRTAQLLLVSFNKKQTRFTPALENIVLDIKLTSYGVNRLFLETSIRTTSSQAAIMGVQDVLSRKTGVIVGDDVLKMFNYAQEHKFAIPAIVRGSQSYLCIFGDTLLIYGRMLPPLPPLWPLLKPHGTLRLLSSSKCLRVELHTFVERLGSPSSISERGELTIYNLGCFQRQPRSLNCWRNCRSGVYSIRCSRVWHSGHPPHRPLCQEATSLVGWYAGCG